jgi:NPCBM/NEW2 domain
MQLWVDDQLVWSSRVRGKEPPLPVRVALRNAKRLKLIVEPGEDFDFADHANWGDARLLKVQP